MAAYYRVEHHTRYVYESVVSTSQHVAYLQPRNLPGQKVAWHALAVDPAPARASTRTDYFGNLAAQFALVKAHSTLDVTGTSLVEVLGFGAAPDAAASPAWEDVREALRYSKQAVYDPAAQFAYASPYVVPDPELAQFARPSFLAGRPLLEASIDLMHRIHTEFRFDASATTIMTPVRRVLHERRGVCQDFAHLQIACLRSLGLAARYVSGYLLTDPPPGQPRLAGADASHAWLSVHCPRHGWVDLDPTNGLLPDTRHVTLAWGRDYGDVSPLRGVILGGMEHKLRVGVSVVPLEAQEWTAALAAVAPDALSAGGTA
jgi:transglutaminase-like putative cysteine protease